MFYTEQSKYVNLNDLSKKTTCDIINQLRAPDEE